MVFLITKFVHIIKTTTTSSVPVDNDDDDSSLAGLDDYETEEDDSSEYELIGVTVHTGTADGGHYYSFIRDRINRAENGLDKW